MSVLSELDAKLLDRRPSHALNYTPDKDDEASLHRIPSDHDVRLVVRRPSFDRVIDTDRVNVSN